MRALLSPPDDKCYAFSSCVREALVPPTKAGLAGICKGGSLSDGSLSDSVYEVSLSALDFFLCVREVLPPSCCFVGVSVELVAVVSGIFLSSYEGEVGKFFESVGSSAGGY